ncbi:MAG: FecR family protein [Flavobacteriaceae bacterium]
MESEKLLEALLKDPSFKNWVDNSNENDIIFWNLWIKDNSDKIETIYIARDILLGVKFSEFSLPNEFVTNEFTSVLDRIEKEESASEKNNKKKFSSSKTSSIVFAGVLGLLLLFVGLKTFNTDSKEILYKTGYGEIINLKLSDGTIVTLNGNSELTYLQKDPRNVTLNGEAYFKVEKKPSTNAKFWVNTRDLTVEVYGTEFNVNTRQDETDVMLDEGSIYLLLKNGTSKKMVPGDLATYSVKKEKIVHKKTTENTIYSTWRDGTFIFNGITLEEVMQNLEATYGVSFHFLNEKTKKKIITGGIPNANLMICLEAIQKSSDIRIKKEGDTFYIYNNQQIN